MKKKNENANKAKKVMVIAPTARVIQLSPAHVLPCNIEFAAKLMPGLCCTYSTLWWF